MSARSLTVVIVDDDPLVRTLIRATLVHAGVTVLAEGADGTDAIELVGRHRPDVLLIDVVMPNLDGVAATRQIIQQWPDQDVVVLTSAADPEIGAVALQAGASGYLTKDLHVEALPRALQGVKEGEPAVSRRMTMRLIELLRDRSRQASTVRPVGGPLTEREWQVVDLLADGLTNDEIASALVVSVETVRTHVKHILRKLDVHSRQEAVRAAERLREAAATGPEGLTRPEA